MTSQPLAQHDNTGDEDLAHPQGHQCAWCCWLIDERGQRIQAVEALLPDASHGICVPCIRIRFPTQAAAILADLARDPLGGQHDE